MTLPSKATLVAGAAAVSDAPRTPPPPKTQTKLSIPFPDPARSGGLSIVGILAHAEPLRGRAEPSEVPVPVSRLDLAAAAGKVGGPVPSEVQSRGIGEEASSSSAGTGRQQGAEGLKPLALILHGVLAHKDQIYHKKLVAALDMDSFRFDFRANHETPGTWSMSSFHEDVEDMRCVIAHLREQHGYRVELLIAHSRGALDAWMYLGEQERNRRAARVRGPPARVEEVEVPAYVVSLSGRWRMERIYDRIKLYEEGFRTEGFFRWKARVAGQDVEARITPEQVAEFAKFPIADYVRDAPLESDVLLITGTADKVVPTSDVGYYVNALSAQSGRRPGSVQMHLVEHADHNFVGHYDEVVQTIVDWLQGRQAVAAATRRRLLEHSAQLRAEDEPAIPSRATATAGVGQGKL